MPLKTLMIEIIIKECTPGQASSKVSELTLFPTEQDLWAWDPFAEGEQHEVQTTFTSLKEMQLFEIDRLLKEEARETERVISAEIESIEPRYSETEGEFAGFNSWSSATAKLISFKISEVSAPKLGQEVPERVKGELTMSLEDFPEALRAKFISDL